MTPLTSAVLDVPLFAINVNSMCHCELAFWPEYLCQTEAIVHCEASVTF